MFSGLRLQAYEAILLFAFQFFGWWANATKATPKQPITEAEAVGFALDKLPQLSVVEAEYIVRLLDSPELSFLGGWKSNSSFIKDMNARLIRGEVVLIDNFLTEAAAKDLYRKMLAFSKKTPDVFALTGASLQYNATGAPHDDHSPADRCKALAALPFYYRHHDYKGQKVSKIVTAFNSKRWLGAMNMLMAGSGMRMLGKDLSFAQTGTLRDWTSGDYSLLHTDSLNNRVLSVNYWLSTPGWRTDMGGDFLYCGAKPVFSNAFRASPKYNRAGIFIPHMETHHAVEVVQTWKEPSYHRFSITTFLAFGGRQLDILRHYNLLFQKQLQMKEVLLDRIASFRNHLETKVVLSRLDAQSGGEAVYAVLHPKATLRLPTELGHKYFVRTGVTPNSLLLHEFVTGDAAEQNYEVTRTIDADL